MIPMDLSGKVAIVIGAGIGIGGSFEATAASQGILPGLCPGSLRALSEDGSLTR